MRNFKMRFCNPRTGKANLSKRCGANMEGGAGIEVQPVDIEAAEKLQAEDFTAGG